MNRRQKQLKKMVFRRILMPVLIIIGALLYQPVRDWLDVSGQPAMVPTDGRKLEILYLDVGQGDATLICKGDFHMLIDAGDNENGEKVVDEMKRRGIEKLDILVGTHPDSDHIGGLDDVIRQMAVTKFYMPTEDKKTDTYRDVLAAMQSKNLPANMPQIGEEYICDGNLILRFLSPDHPYTDSNNNSLVVQLAYGKTRFLFMGDAEEEAEREILSGNYDLDCDVLKVGHHGSYTATGIDFLRRADPAYAVISCGRDNRYGHPHQETLTKLEDEDVQVYRTDRMGTIQAVSDGTDVKLSTGQKGIFSVEDEEE